MYAAEMLNGCISSRSRPSTKRRQVGVPTCLIASFKYYINNTGGDRVVRGSKSIGRSICARKASNPRRSSQAMFAEKRQDRPETLTMTVDRLHTVSGILSGLASSTKVT